MLGLIGNNLILAGSLCIFTDNVKYDKLMLKFQFEAIGDMNKVLQLLNLKNLHFHFRENNAFRPRGRLSASFWFTVLH